MANALFGKYYLLNRHGKYHSKPQKVIAKIQDQWYGILERRLMPTVKMVSTKQAKKLINHAKKLMILMIKPQHPRKIAATSCLSTDHNSQQKQRVDKILEEYQYVFKDPTGVQLNYYIKHSIDLVPGSSLPNASL